MLKTIKDIKIFGAILIFIITIFCIATYLASDYPISDDYFIVNAYFVNSSTLKLEGEARAVLKASNEEMIAQLLLDILYKGPHNKMLAKTIPSFVQLRKGEFIENKYLLELEFDTGGESMTGEEELYFKSSLVHTLTELPMVSDIHIYINGREMLNTDGSPVGLLNRDNVIINRDITPFETDVYRVLLYFADESYTSLMSEERVIQVAKSSPDRNIEKRVVEELIAGPSKPNHFPTVPTEVKVRDVSTEGDICYVNLSKDALTRYINSEASIQLTLYSIVNSLTEFEEIKKVQFLIDSNKPENIIGGYDLSTPMERNESLISEER